MGAPDWTPRKPFDLRERLLEFACLIVRLVQFLHTRGPVSAALSYQLLKCGTPADANYEEGDDGPNRCDAAEKRTSNANRLEVGSWELGDMRKLTLALIGISFAAIGVRAQEKAAQAAPAFEVASVKPSNPSSSGPIGMLPMVMPAPNGRLTATNVPLRLLVRMAYGVQDFQIEGGPSWQLSQRFDITAKAEDGSPATMVAMLPMLKSLLADRFKLKVHTETKEMTVSSLVIASEDGKLGPKLKPTSSDCSNAQAENEKLAEAVAKGGPGALAGILPKPGETRKCAMMPTMGPDGFGMRADGQPLTVIAQLLTQATGRIVTDKTGLMGLYDWEIKFDPQIMLQIASQVGVNLPAGANLPASDSPSLLTALREDLGLKLNSERGPVEVIVIDSAEMPEAN